MIFYDMIQYCTMQYDHIYKSTLYLLYMYQDAISVFMYDLI